MRNLVRHYIEDRAARVKGVFLFVKQQREIRVDDAAPVLHPARAHAGKCDLVELRQRVANAEVFVEKREHLPRRSQRKREPLAFPRRGEKAQLHAFTFAFECVEFRRHKRHEIARHRWRRAEDHLAPTGIQRAFVHRGHVKKSRVFCRHHRRKLEGRAEHRLIPAREHPPRIRWLHLRGHRLVPFAAGLLVAREVNPLRGFPQCAGKLDVEAVLPCRKLARRSEREELSRVVHFHHQRLSIRSRFRNRQPCRIQDERARGFRRHHVNIHCAGELRRCHVRLNANRVMARDHVLG